MEHQDLAPADADALFPPSNSETPLARWRARLQPFLDALQFKLRVDVAPLPSRAALHALDVSLNYFATETFHAASWALALEALELLDLLVRVVARVGWTLLLELADVDRVFRINEAALFDYAAARAPQYALELDSDEMMPYLVPGFDAVRAMIAVTDTRARSAAFVEIQRELLDAWSATHNGELFDRAMQGRIRIKPRVRVEGGGLLARVAYDLEALVAAVEQARAQVALMGVGETVTAVSPFVVEAVDLHFAGADQPSQEIADTLISIACRGVTIASLAVEPLLLASGSVDALFVKLLRPPRHHTALARLELTSADYTDDGVRSLCTALAHSRGLTEFVMSGAESTHWIWSPWLAFALFRADTTHDIRSVTLPMKGFAARHVQFMLDVLEHPSPLALLTSGGLGGSNPDESCIPWIGCGSRITELKLDYVDPAPRAAVLELLGLVGASLERLTLKHYGVDSFSYEFMDAVMVRCPNLQRLEIAEAGVSLDWLYAPRPDDRPRAEPRALVLEGRMENPTASEFFRTLGRSDHRLSKTLTQLHCSLWRTKTPPFEMVDAWLDMLESNRRLERSEIVMSEKGVSAYKLAKYRERFEAHNGDRLEDRHRLAFLSAMSPRTRESAKPLISTEIMTLVMDFAWARKRRICG